VELDDGIDDALDPVVVELRIDGQRQHLTGGALGDIERIGHVGTPSECGLVVQRNGIVHLRRDPPRREVRRQGVTARRLDDVLVPHVVRARERREHERTGVGEPCPPKRGVVAGRDRTATRVPRVEVRQLDDERRGVRGGEPGAGAERGVAVRGRHPLVAIHAYPRCERVVVGEHHAPVPDPAQVLRRVEGQAPRAPERAGRTRRRPSADGLRGVLHDPKPMALGEAAERLHVGDAAVEVDRKDPDDPVRIVREHARDGAGVEIERRRVHVHEHGTSAEPGYAARRREERKRRRDHPGPGSDPDRRERQREGIGPRPDADGVPCPGVGDHGGLEGLDVRTENAVLVLEHGTQRVLERRTEAPRLLAKIDERHSHRPAPAGATIPERAREAPPATLPDPGPRGTVSATTMGRRRGGVLRRMLVWGTVVVALATAATGWILGRELLRDLPSLDRVHGYRPPVATRIYAADGTLIAELATERRYLVPLTRVPRHVREAFLAAEDADFYRHSGVSPISIARAAVANLRARGVSQGASTITQQLVKILLLTPERTVQRKLREMVLALRLETQFSKDEILEMYLNQIYLGAGAYGVQAAAQTYFGVDVEDLTIAQAAMLAGLPQRPSAYDPYRNFDAARERQRYVLDRMLTERLIDSATYRDARATEIELAPRQPAATRAAPWYVEHVRRLLEERYGGTAVSQLGLHVHTAVDVRLQAYAEAAVRDGLDEVSARLGWPEPLARLAPDAVDDYLARQAAARTPGMRPLAAVVVAAGSEGLVVRTPWERGLLPHDALTWHDRPIPRDRFRVGDVLPVVPIDAGVDGTSRFGLDPTPEIQGALVAFDLYTGEVKAMVGGYDLGRSHFNRVVQARRQPGSAFKPFIYTAALERGYTPASVVVDAPLSFPDGRGRTWTPKNYDDRYFGPTPLRAALNRSLNTVSVRLAAAVGPVPLGQSLDRFGFSRRFPPHLSMALGSEEVTPLELVRAYGVFATLGNRFTPIFITRVTDDDGTVVGEWKPSFERALDPAVAYVVTNMLETVVQFGTGRRALALGRPVAGKTGTTNESRDAWFVGYSPDLLAGVWVGYDADRSLGRETGGRAALPIWVEFMQAALADRPPVEFPRPRGVVEVHIDPATGLRAVPGGATRVEVFAAGTEPREYAPLPTPVHWPHGDERPGGGEPLAPPPGGSQPLDPSRAPADAPWDDRPRLEPFDRDGF
jgi:penicillin-binding protein 1A